MNRHYGKHPNPWLRHTHSALLVVTFTVLILLLLGNLSLLGNMVNVAGMRLPLALILLLIWGVGYLGGWLSHALRAAQG